MPHEIDVLPKGPLTEDEVQAFRAMLRDYRNVRWLKRLAFKITLAVGATGTAIAAFRDDIMGLFARGP